MHDNKNMATLQMKIDHVHAEFVSGNAVSSTVTTHSVVSRDGSGNVHANKFKSVNMELTHNVPTSDRTSDDVFYSSVDDIIRKNTAAGMRSSLGLANSATITAASGNTGSAIVVRDSSGDFSAGTITAALNGNADTASSCSGNAATATALATARTIGGVSFDGSGNIDLKGVNIAGDQDTSGNAATASSCSGNAATATNADKLDNVHLDDIFNNMGGAHSNRSDFDAVPDAGCYYITGNTNGPGVNSASQYYGFTLGLGGYDPVVEGSSNGKYGCQIYWGRNVSNPYINVRYLENGAWGSWNKAAAGYADSAGYATSAGSAGNADTVDNLHAGSFLRSDADDTVGAGVTYTWSATNTHGLKFVNASYSAYSLQIGGWTSSNDNNISRIRNSSGNLHIDSAANGNLYLNHYSSGTLYITTNTYNSGTFESDGRIYADNGCHVRGDWLRVNGNNGIYWESHGGGWYMQDSSWVRIYNQKGLWCANGIMATDYRCGVGTSGPSVPLHVYGTGASLNNGNFRYMSVGGSGSGYGTWGAICASFEGGHVRSTDSFLAHNGSLNTSDERIKKEISDINDASALETLRLIQPKTYKYKDEEKMGSDVVYGFIAQQVQEVLPYATKTLTEYLPSIREMVNVTQSNVVTFTNFNTNDLLSNTTIIQAQLFKGEYKDLTISEIIDEHSIRVEEDLTEMLHEDDTRLYIYGEQVDDFLFLKKESIFTVATAALQEVDRQLQAEKAKVATLETQLASVLARLDALENA
jgi:hypothetical protein